MKQYDNLFEEIISFSNLLSASRNARKGKRNKHYTALFEMNLENELHNLKNELLNQSYKPSGYKEFFIYEPKHRMISAAPYKDRVIHHALCNVIEPIFERSFIFDSYANRKGKGTHKALQRFKEFVRKNKYVLKCDIKKYFPSIDHEILKQIIQEKIICTNTLWLIDLIIDNSNPQEKLIDYFEGDTLFTPIERRKGLPIGNLTSQFFANVYLNKLDHFIKEILKCKYYIRYVDDFLLFSNSKIFLREVETKISVFLETLRLKIHDNKTKIYNVKDGVNFLGFKCFDNYRLVRRDNLIRAKRRFSKIEKNMNQLDKQFILQSVNGWLGHVIHANSYNLIERYKQLYPSTFSFSRI